MIYQLEQSDFYKIEVLIKNSYHELSIKAVINGTSPGKIFVDNLEKPLSTLIITTECKVVAGKADNKLFNIGVKEKLGFFDTLTCDNEEWENNIHEIHKNIALRKYIRRYYELDELKFVDFNRNMDSQYTLEYVNVGNLNNLDFENSDKIRDWIKFVDISTFKDYCLGAYVRIDKKIVSMSLVDCIVDDRIEIGVKTEKEYKKRGLGSLATAATVSSCISKGINKIGWHCVDTNIGSIKTAEKVGFKLIKKYSSYTPFPPIENDTDLSKEQWGEWATYYAEMNKIQPNYFWLSAGCWAKASKMEEAIENIMKLIETGQMWFVEYLPKIDAFKAFEGKKEWEKLLRLINK